MLLGANLQLLAMMMAVAVAVMTSHRSCSQRRKRGLLLVELRFLGSFLQLAFLGSFLQKLQRRLESKRLKSWSRNSRRRLLQLLWRRSAI